jgi:transcriptional regulator with XRE-family HTH domain
LKVPRLREWRHLRGYTQVELAERAGVSASAITGYERGFNIRPSTARKLAEALGVEIPDLLGPDAAPRLPLTPTLTLAPMYEANDAGRRRALETASADDLTRYVAEIEDALENAWRAMRSPQRQLSRESRLQLSRYVQRLMELRDEAAADIAVPPTPREVEELLHA